MNAHTVCNGVLTRSMQRAHGFAKVDVCAYIHVLGVELSQPQTHTSSQQLPSSLLHLVNSVSSFCNVFLRSCFETPQADSLWSKTVAYSLWILHPGAPRNIIMAKTKWRDCGNNRGISIDSTNSK